MVSNNLISKSKGAKNLDFNYDPIIQKKIMEEDYSVQQGNLHRPWHHVIVTLVSPVIKITMTGAAYHIVAFVNVCHIPGDVLLAVQSTP